MPPSYSESLTSQYDLKHLQHTALVYRLIEAHQPISRIHLAELTGLAPASITKATQPLIKQRLVVEVCNQASSGGRPPISLMIPKGRFQILALRLGRSDVTLNLYDLAGNVLLQQQISVKASTQLELQQQLLSHIRYILNLSHSCITKLIAITLVLPGLIDAKQGIVHYMPHLNISNWRLAEVIQQDFHVPTLIGHDTRSLALAEHYFGCTQQCEDAIVLRIDQGVGAGVMVNREIYLAAKGNLAEVGHLQIEPLGLRCSCGHFGCLETLVSHPAIEARAKKLLQEGYPSQLSLADCHIQAICAAVKSGDLLALQLIKEIAEPLGKAIAILVNLFNPQKIVLIGTLVLIQENLIPNLWPVIQQQAIPEFCKELVIEGSNLDGYSAIGAFALAKQAMFNGVLLQHLLA